MATVTRQANQGRRGEIQKSFTTKRGTTMPSEGEVEADADSTQAM